MFPRDWTPPCGSCCTKKYATLVQIPWRVFCKKGCDADGDTWDECIGECEEICYKDPVFKDQQWSAYIDRSPGDNSYSMECFNACISGCGFKSLYFANTNSPIVNGSVAHPTKKNASVFVHIEIVQYIFVCENDTYSIYQFEIPPEQVKEVKPSRPLPPPPPPRPPVIKPDSPENQPTTTKEDLPCTSA